MEKKEWDEIEQLLSEYQNHQRKDHTLSILQMTNPVHRNTFNDEFLSYRRWVQEHIRDRKLSISTGLLWAINSGLWKICELQNFKLNTPNYKLTRDYYMMLLKLSDIQYKITSEYLDRLFIDPNDVHEDEIWLDQDRIIQLGNIRGEMKHDPHWYINDMSQWGVSWLHLPQALIQLRKQYWEELFVNKLIENKEHIYPLINSWSAVYDLMIFNWLLRYLDLRDMQVYELLWSYLNYWTLKHRDNLM